MASATCSGFMARSVVRRPGAALVGALPTQRPLDTSTSQALTARKARHAVATSRWYVRDSHTWVA